MSDYILKTAEQCKTIGKYLLKVNGLITQETKEIILSKLKNIGGNLTKIVNHIESKDNDNKLFSMYLKGIINEVELDATKKEIIINDEQRDGEQIQKVLKLIRNRLLGIFKSVKDCLDTIGVLKFNIPNKIGAIDGGIFGLNKIEKMLNKYHDNLVRISMYAKKLMPVEGNVAVSDEPLTTHEPNPNRENSCNNY